jgi:integrase/recombinase XerD
VQQLLTHYEAFLLTQKRVARNTFIAYKQDIAQLLSFLEKRGVTTPAGVKKELLVAYLAQLQQESATPRTLARKVSAMRSFFAYVHQHHGQELELELVLPKVTKKLPLYCTPEEIQQIFAVCNKDSSPIGQRNKLLIYMLYTTGMRVSELISVRLSDIHYDTGMLHITGKGGKSRIIPLMTETLALLKAYIATHHAQFVRKKTLKDLLFPLTRQAVATIIKQIVRQTTITKPVSAHTFRHSLATHGLQQGWDLRSLQLLLGHEQVSTVEIYTHVEVSHLQAAYKKKHPRA